MALAAHARGRIGAAQRDMLIDGHVIVDFGAFADYAEAVVEKEALSDLCSGMDVDSSQEAREMVDEPRDEPEIPLPQPMRDAMKPERRHSRVEEYVPAGARGRVTSLD